MSEYVGKRGLIDFLNEEMKQDIPDAFKIRNIQIYIDDAMVDEKEIIRKAFERVVERLEEELKLSDIEKERCIRENLLQFDEAKGYSTGISNAIDFVKEEGGIE